MSKAGKERSDDINVKLCTSTGWFVIPVVLYLCICVDQLSECYGELLYYLELDMQLGLCELNVLNRPNSTFFHFALFVLLAYYDCRSFSNCLKVKA